MSILIHKYYSSLKVDFEDKIYLLMRNLMTDCTFNFNGLSNGIDLLKEIVKPNK